ncbi:MAG: YbhN family protein [Solirubrobacteraceae bacterium]
MTSAPRYRSLILQFVLIAGLLGLVAFVVSGAVPGSSGRLQHTSIAWIGVAALVELTACAAYAWLFHGVFSHGDYRVSPVRSTQIGVGELAGFAVTPTGAGGPALRLWALLRGGMPFRAVMTRSVVHSVVFQVPYVVASVLLGLAAVFGIGGGHAPTALALAPIALVTGAVLLVVGISRLSRRPARAHSRWRKTGREIIEAIPVGVRETPGRVRERPWLVLGAIGYWTADCGVLVVAFAALHGSAPIAVIVLAYMLGQLGNALPLPGGIGGVEPAMLGVLTSSGVDPALGGAAVVLYRFVSLGLQSAAGSLAIATLIPALNRERPQVEPAPRRRPEPATA